MVTVTVEEGCVEMGTDDEQQRSGRGIEGYCQAKSVVEESEFEAITGLGCDSVSSDRLQVESPIPLQHSARVL